MTAEETYSVQKSGSHFVAGKNPQVRKEVNEFVSHFAPFVDPGHEWIADGEGKSRGLLFRGNGKEMTTAVEHWLEREGVAPGTKQAFTAMASFFKHCQCYFKQEWSQNPEQEGSRMGCYFKNGVQTIDLLTFWRDQGVNEELLRAIYTWTQTMEKDSVHFGAMAIDPTRGFFWKIYLTQYYNLENSGLIHDRISKTMEDLGIHSDARQNLLTYYPQLLSGTESTSLFLSLSFSRNDILPSLKLDVPDVKISKLLEMMPPEVIEQRKVLLGKMARGPQNGRLSYLGVRVEDQAQVRLKYYADQ